MERILAHLLFIILFGNLLAIPLYKQNDDKIYPKIYHNETNGTAHDLYVIRTIIYEVGILTDADNSTDDSSESHEQVDLTFYDPKHNKTTIDLSNIPIPIQTNVSRQIITGIEPANFGVISLGPLESMSNKSQVLNPLHPNVPITQTNNLTTSDESEEEQIVQDIVSSKVKM